MNTKIKTSIFFISILSFLASQLLRFPSIALAQNATALTIAPARQQLDLKPGESTNIILKLMNTGTSPVVGSLSVANFIVTSADGKPQFLENKLALPSKYAAATWFRLPYDRLAVPAQGKVEMQIKITAPKNALPGGHYAAIIFEPTADTSIAAVPDKAGQSSISPRIAGLVYIVDRNRHQEHFTDSYPSDRHNYHHQHAWGCHDGPAFGRGEYFP
ncbi:hypothetical protein HYU90_00730 [Candidatus Collierbacteria bacterium]|nr:hypothetical protein [Candidatus Collierbacteria bacterium]